MWTYITSALLIFAAVVACIYGYRSFGRGEGETDPPLTEVNAGKGTPPPVFVPPEPNLSKTTFGPTAKPNPEAAELIGKAMAFTNAMPARIIDARDILNDALAMPMNRQQRAVVKKQLSELADKWLFSRTFFPQDRLCESYWVKPREQLRTIGKQRKVPWEILRDINRIERPENLQAGERIKVINGPFHARIYRSAFTMDLYLQNTFVRSFPVGLGQPDMETPTGTWLVEPGRKLIKPPWPDPVTGKILYPGDPDYALGSRWIGLKGIEGSAKGRTGFGIHGTKDPETIGTASSRGCIRLHNGDAILIYNLLVPSFSRVEVVE
jgi:hypothetical protein